MKRHHGVEEKGQIDPLGLAGKLEGGAVPIEGEGSLGGSDCNRSLVVPREQSLLDHPLGRPVNELERPFPVGHGGDHRNDLTGLDAGQTLPCCYVFEFHASCSCPPP